MPKFVMLRLYDGGGLARHEVVRCHEDDLNNRLAWFEEECVEDNEGEYTAVLDEKEFKHISKDMKG
jgi:hypothetical protein